jgi:FAD/FMN-containing dehydrogenase
VSLPSQRTARTSAWRSWGGLSTSGSVGIGARGWRGGPGPVLAVGNGRSYGDSGLLDDGTIIDAADLDRIESFDAATGLIVCEAGVLLSAILARCVPQGWFLPVTPGTRLVSIAGALANDVHGKNHHALGTFGRHVPWFELVRSDGQVLRCSPTSQPDVYRATIGGLGLTGLITRVALQLIPIRSPLMVQDTLPFGSLSGFFDLAAASDQSHAYTVAWLDSMATSAALGRGVFFRANHSDEPAPSGLPPERVLPFLPFTPPVSLLNRVSLGVFNRLYRFAHRQPVRDACVPFQPFFYPLDRICGWNRAYGPRGLRQFQCVVPMAVAQEAVADLLRATNRAGEASFLTVLKLFGDVPSPGLMSFPMAGATLTLDVPYRGARTDALLAELDRITMAAGGRVNPYKDARMPAAVFRASFPQWQDFARHIDPAFMSNFWRRVAGPV